MNVWIDGRRSAKHRLARCMGSGKKNRWNPRPTEQGGGKAKIGKIGGKVKKDIASQKTTRTKTWTDVVNGLKEDELETANSDKS